MQVHIDKVLKCKWATTGASNLVKGEGLWLGQRGELPTGRCGEPRTGPQHEPQELAMGRMNGYMKVRILRV